MDDTANEPTTHDPESDDVAGHAKRFRDPADVEAHHIRRGPEDAGVHASQDAGDESDVEAHRVPRGV